MTCLLDRSEAIHINGELGQALTLQEGWEGKGA